MNWSHSASACWRKPWVHERVSYAEVYFEHDISYISEKIRKIPQEAIVTMKYLLKTEYILASLATIVAYLAAGFEWYWLLVFFLAFDISALGYLFNTRIGAFTYNLAHSLIGPTLLLSSYFPTHNQIILFISLLWFFHIFVDRAFGYGLKHSDSFHHTHLGRLK